MILVAGGFKGCEMKGRVGSYSGVLSMSDGGSVSFGFLAVTTQRRVSVPVERRPAKTGTSRLCSS